MYHSRFNYLLTKVMFFVTILKYFFQFHSIITQFWTPCNHKTVIYYKQSVNPESTLRLHLSLSGVFCSFRSFHSSVFRGSFLQHLLYLHSSVIFRAFSVSFFFKIPVPFSVVSFFSSLLIILFSCSLVNFCNCMVSVVSPTA